jgi:hypothetical protein
VEVDDVLPHPVEIQAIAKMIAKPSDLKDIRRKRALPCIRAPVQLLLSTAIAFQNRYLKDTTHQKDIPDEASRVLVLDLLCFSDRELGAASLSVEAQKRRRTTILWPDSLQVLTD